VIAAARPQNDAVRGNVGIFADGGEARRFMAAVGAEIAAGFDALARRGYGLRAIGPHLGIFVGLFEDGPPQFVFG
jgi:hypothetical protein